MTDFNLGYEHGLMGQARKALVVGSVGYALSKYALFTGRSHTWRIFGNRLNQHMAVFAAAAIASVISDWAHEYILPTISHDNKLVEKESMVLTPLLGAAGMVGLVYAAGGSQLLNDATVGFAKIAALGAAAEILGSMAYSYANTLVLA